MKKKVLNDNINDQLMKDLKNRNLPTTKYNNYFHLTDKSMFSEHNNFICTNIIQNRFTNNLYLSLKQNSTGEGYIFDKNNNIYIKAHSQLISKLLINNNYNYLISSSYDKYIKIWDISKLKMENIFELKGHKGRIYDMDLIKDKNKILSCGMEKYIYIWDIEKFILTKKIEVLSTFQNILIKYFISNINLYKNNLNEIICIYSKKGVVNIIDINIDKNIETINIYSNGGPILFINNEEIIYQNAKKNNLIIYNFISKKINGELNECNIILIFYKIDKLNKIISFDKGNNIKIWNYIKKYCELCIKIDFVLNCLYVDSEGILYCGSFNKTLIYN